MEKRAREDKRTEAEVREAEKMQRAFGDDAARSFLKKREVPEEVASRVLEHVEQRRQY